MLVQVVIRRNKFASPLVVLRAGLVPHTVAQFFSSGHVACFLTVDVCFVKMLLRSCVFSVQVADVSVSRRDVLLL